MSALRIAVFHDLPSGGAKRAVREQVRGLVRLGHHVDVFLPSTAEERVLPLSEVATAVRVFPLESASAEVGASDPPQLREAPLRWLRYLPRVRRAGREIARAIDAGGYDVALVHPSRFTQAPYVLRWLRTPSIYYCQEPLRVAYDPRIAPFVPRILLRHTLGRIDATNLRAATVLTANSRFTAGRILDLYGRSPRVLYLGVDVEQFRPQSLERDQFVLTVGALHPTKGLHFIVDSLARLSESLRPPLLVVSDRGQERERRRIEARAAAHGVRITFRSRVPEAELAELYNRARLLLYAPYDEPFGLVPLEAMACGCPVLGVGEGGIVETVCEGETGFLGPRDPEQFAARITEILGQPEVGWRVARRAVEIVRERWSWTRSVAELSDLCDEVAQRHRAALISVTQVGLPPASIPSPRRTIQSAQADVVDVVIVNWNGARYLPECLLALERSVVPLRIMVVDNASRDDSVAYLLDRHPRVQVVERACNAGYAGGANTALRRAVSDYALVMNPDVLLARDYVERLKTRLDADPSVGAAQGKLYQIAPEEFSADRVRPGGRLDSAGHVIRRSRMVVDRGQGREDGPQFSQPASVFSASGAALFLRRAMLEDVAPDGEYFDESFFAYKEDIDLCWRARLLGWDVRYVPDAVGYHVRAWSGRGLPPKDQLSLAARRHSWKNHYLLLLKNDRPADLVRALPAVIGWELVRQAYALFRDPTVYAAYLDLVRLLPAAFRRRRATMRRRRVMPGELRRWFGSQPRALDTAGATAPSAFEARRAADRAV